MYVQCSIPLRMAISWDDRKNEANFKKHGVWFEEAATVIINPLTLSAPNDYPAGNRMEYLGFSLNFKLIYVVTVEHNEDNIRIISARKATNRERAKYEEGI